LGYYAGAWIAKALRFPDSHLALIWPPTAILLAALLLVPLRKWWIYLLAVAPVHAVVQLQDGVPGWGVVSQLIGNFSQASLAAFSVRYFNKEAPLFNNFRGVVVFTLGAMLFAPVVVSSIAAYLYVLSGWEQSYWYAWKARVLSNALSTLMIVPPILLVGRGMVQTAKLEIWRSLEIGLIAAGFGLIGVAAFRTENAVAVFLYAPLPLLVWATVRFGVGGLCFSLLVTAYLVFLDASGGQGPFATRSPAENMLALQLFLITISLPLLLLAVLIQERRDKEQTLRASEARYRALVMASAEIVWRANARGEGFFVNPSWQQLTGQNENEMREFGWLQAVHPDDRERTGRLWERAMIEKCTYENELRIRTRDGSYRHFSVHAVPILAPHGDVHEWVGANIDITERKQAEQALQDLVAGTGVIGEEFFPAYVRHVAAALDVQCATVAEVTDEQNSRLRTLAVWVGKGLEKNYEYDVADAPCGQVLREEKLFYCRERVQERFPECRSLGDLNAVSYMGSPLFNSAGQLIGSLCIIDNKPLEDERRAKSILEIFAARAAAEIERKRAEDALRESEERLARAEKSSFVMVTHADLEGRWLKVPPTLCALLGYSEEELLGGYSKDVTHPDDFEAGWRQCQRLIRGEIKSFDLEKRYIHRDGHIVWAYLNCSMVTDSKGNPVCFLGYIRDITDRKRAEEALRESQALLKTIMDNCPAMIFLKDPQGRYLFANQEFERLTGPRVEVVGKTDFEIFPQEQAAAFHANDIQVLEAGAPLRFEEVALREDGPHIGVVCKFPLFDEAERLYALGGIVTDITDRKQAEQALRESEQALRDSEERLRLALKSGRMGVWDWDRRTKLGRWSKEYFLVMGLLPFSVEPSYQTWANCVHPEDLPHAKAAVEAAVAEKKEYRFEYRVIWPDGTIRWVEARGEPIFDQDGQCVRLMGVLADVTERKLAEEEIRRLKERLEAENVYLRREVSEAYRDREIIGRSEGILKVLRQVNQVAGTDMTVLVLGETGTGKELVARAVHGQSGRRERPLVKVNCSALPGELIESELFGHEKGAFTGATGRQVGRFELADGGTVFLDEVGDLPLKLQAKLLRVLQEGEFERLGSGKTIKVDVRVITATNRDLLQAVQRGRFRVDLYYRLNVYPIGLPSLRERREDIGLLAEVFLREASRRLGRLFDPISGEVLEALRRYEWPGNIRELQNVIERAAVISVGRRFQLPEGWASSEAWRPATTGSVPPLGGEQLHKDDDRPLEEGSLDEVGRNYILQILQQTGWRVEGPKGAARILGLNPSTLRSRMLKLGIRRPFRSKAEVQD
jgi:PAS domain S-box-containing protein